MDRSLSYLEHQLYIISIADSSRWWCGDQDGVGDHGGKVDHNGEVGRDDDYLVRVPPLPDPRLASR